MKITKKQEIFIFFVIVFIENSFIVNFCKGQTDTESSIEFLPGTKIVFADVNEARKILATKDNYIKS